MWLALESGDTPYLKVKQYLCKNTGMGLALEWSITWLLDTSVDYISTQPPCMSARGSAWYFCVNIDKTDEDNQTLVE